MWWITILLGLLVAWIVLSATRSGFEEAGIPKIIWSYWAEGDQPELVKKCINSWRIHNPDWDIRVLNRRTVSQWVPSLKLDQLKHNDGPTRESDFVRLYLLAAYGGFWVDASIIMTESLDHLQIKNGAEFIGYYIDGFTTRPEYPVVENWFFGCVTGSSFVKKWRDEFTSLNSHSSVRNYVKTKIESGVDIQKIKAPEYLAMHVAAQTVMQKDLGPDGVEQKLHLMKAEDGPFKFLVSGNWRSRKALENLCENDHLKTPIIKLRGPERFALDRHPSLKCVYKFLN